MKKERKAIFRIIGSIALIVLLIGTSILWGQLILKRMRSYIETNGKNNMATIMEQMSQSYDIQLNAYFCKLEQTERFLFQDGQREISLEEWKDFFDTAASENTEELLFMKNNGEVTTTDGRKTRLDIQSQMLIDLHQDQKIAQSVTLSSNGRNGNYFLIAIPCKTYTVNGENYHAIAALLDRTDIDTMLELNGYGGAAYIFLVDENGIVNYTNQPGENFYRNFALLKQLRKDKAISDGQYDALVEAVKSKQQRIELFDGNDAPFYLGCYPVANSNHSLICIVARSVVNNSLIAYQNTVIRLLAGYIGIVLLLCIALIYFSFRVRISSKKMAYEEEKRQIQEKAMKELETAKNRADDANRAKSEFLSNMSHDIRTPMNAIVGITKLMEHERNDPEKMEEYIHKVQTSSKHLLSLINDVLDMSKIESGGVMLNRESVSLADQVWQVDSIVHPQARERGQHFEIRLHGIVHEFFAGDAVRLRQVIINLLSNAIKYTPAGGHILFEVSELESEDMDHAVIRFSVKDTGCGMTQEFLEKIFDPFTRAENSTTNKIQGTGLGMAITKKIVDLMGGSIEVRSQPDQGSTFVVTLPMEIDKEAAVEFPCKSVLVVSDEETFVENIRAAFRESEVCVRVAGTEAEAERLLERGPVDAVLLGSRLEGRSLKASLPRLREKAGKALLIYCCEYTGQAQLDGIGKQGGVDGMVARPVFLSTLAHTLEQAEGLLPESSEESGSVLNGLRFLCAEDNVLNAEILTAVLDMNGAQCVIYPDGEKLVQAFAAVKPGDFDAILMDVQMPVMNGLDATRAIRRSANSLGKTIPIIAMTANAFSEDVQNCLNAGMDAHVSKPLDIGTLERTLRTVLGGKFSGGGHLYAARRRMT